jgi:hypothetical protein
VSPLGVLGYVHEGFDYFFPFADGPAVTIEGCTSVPICDPPSGTLFKDSITQVTCRIPDGRPCTFLVEVDFSEQANEAIRLPDLPQPIAAHGLFAVGDTVAILGGERPSGPTKEVATIIQKLKLIGESLRELPDKTFNAAVSVCPNRVAVIGGSAGGGNDVYELKLEHGPKTLVTQLKEIGWALHADRLPKGIANAAAACVPSLGGHVLLGGQSGGVAITDAFLIGFDGGPATPLPSMAVATHGNVAIVDEANRRVLSFGGYNDTDGVLSTVQAFDLDTSQWSVLPNMPTPRFGAAAALMPDGKEVAIIGGFSDKYESTIDLAKLINELVWRAGPQLTVPRSEAAAAATRDAIWIAGGFHNFRATSVFELIPLSGYACVTTPDSLCVENREFEIEVTFTVPGGQPQRAHPFALNGSSGYFTVFDPSNIELVIKVLDARTINDHYWVFGAGLTNLRVDIEVTDLTTGATKTYSNPQGQTFRTINDTAAFAGGSRATPQRASTPTLGAQTASAATTSAVSDLAQLENAILEGEAPERLSTGGPLFLSAQDRFRVDVTFQVPDGTQGVAEPTKLTSDSGYFTFFDPANVEIVAKVLDACATNGQFWVFLAGLTDLGVAITVTDTTNGSVKTYENPPSTVFRSVLDIAAFPAC